MTASDSEMQRFESSRPSQPVRSLRAPSEGRGHIPAKRPIQVRRSRALLDIRVVKSSILERNVLRIGDVFAL
jgi:hypothetical protein